MKILPPLAKGGVKKIIPGPNREDGRGEEVLECHLSNINIALEAIIMAQFFCKGRIPMTQMCAF